MSGGHKVVAILVGIAAVVGIHVALDVKTQEAPLALRRNSLEKFAEKMTCLSIAHSGSSVIRLVKDGSWNIVFPYAAEAEQGVVLRLSDALAFSPVVDAMTDSELLRIGRTREDFGLKNPRLVVTVGDVEKKVSIPVHFGLSTPAGDGVYATVGESDTVYVVSTNVFAAVNVNAADLRRRRLFAIEPDAVVSFDVKNGSGHFVRLVSRDGAWKVLAPREGIASSGRVRRFLDALTHLEAQSFVWPTGATNEAASSSSALLAGYGVQDDSSVTVTLKCLGDVDKVVSFGRGAGMDRVYACAPDGSIVTVSAAVRSVAVMGINAFVDTRLFPMEASAVNAIALDDDGRVCLLSHSSDGEWRLDAPVSAAADAEAVSALIGRMLALKSTDVDAAGIRISVGTNAVPVSVRRETLLAGLRVADLRSKEITRLESKLVKRVVTADGGGKPTAVIHDAEKDAWIVESAATSVVADGEALAKMLDALRSLRAVRIERLKVAASELGQFGLDKPFRTIAIDQTAEGSVRRNILIGDVTDGGRFATIGASDAVFVISSASAAALLAPIAK